MKTSYKLSFQIWALTFICGSVFFIIALYWYQDYASIMEFISDFFILKNWYLLVCIAIFSLFIALVSRYFISHIFEKIQENNTKLKDYNHFLAHELKTPISVMYSHLDMLMYGYDKKIVEKSRDELKNMIHIIDGLLNFSESIKILSKKNINLENFIKNFTLSLETKDNIVIFNEEFNFSIYTDELLFGRAVQNLIDNALKYSHDEKLEIYIHQDRIIFQNSLEKELLKWELGELQEKSFNKTFEEKRGHGIGIPMLKEITKELWFEMNICTEKKKFIVEIIFN